MIKLSEYSPEMREYLLTIIPEKYLGTVELCPCDDCMASETPCVVDFPVKDSCTCQGCIEMNSEIEERLFQHKLSMGIL